MPVPVQLLRRQEVRAVPVARVVRAAALRGVGGRGRRGGAGADGAARARAGVPAALLRGHLRVLRQPSGLLLPAVLLGLRRYGLVLWIAGVS